MKSIISKVFKGLITPVMTTYTTDKNVMINMLNEGVPVA